MKKIKLKSDKYRKSRGGYSRFLNIFCAKCGNHLFLYQKDGPGPLKRSYMDRILAPQNLVGLEKAEDVKNVPMLVCSSCKSQIGIPYIYEKENRKAFLLDPLSFVKKIGKGVYPPNIAKI